MGKRSIHAVRIMIDLKKRVLPQSVEVGGRHYPVQTDFRYYIRFSELIGRKGINLSEFDFMYRGRMPENRAAGFEALCAFFFPKKELPRILEGTNEPVMDYVLDAPYIYAAFMERYGIDLIDIGELHFMKFTALLDGLHDTRLCDIMSFRAWRSEGGTPEYNQRMMQLKEMWRLPDKSDSEDEELADFDARLNA